MTYISRSLALSILLPAAAWANDARPVWTLGEDLVPRSLSSPAATRAARVEIHAEALNGGDVTLDLFGEQLRFRTQTLQRHREGQVSWVGQLWDNPDFQASLSLHDGHVAGFVSVPDGYFELTPSADGNRLLALDQGRFPACGGALDAGDWLAPQPLRTVSSNTLVPEDTGEDIKVLLMYSPAARDAAGGVAQIEAQAQAAVDSANLAFGNSAMRMRFSVVGVELLDGWVEGASSASTELSNFRANTTAQTRRNALNADMVSLLVAALPGACGIGYVMRNTNVSFAGNAYQISDRDCAVGNLSWAHEHGHNVGFEHDPANGTTPTAASRPWSFGHYVESGATAYRTVMSYACPAGNCTRRPYFSNPRVTFNGAPTGIESQRDNARTGDAVADIVANFRAVVFSYRNGFE